MPFNKSMNTGQLFSICLLCIGLLVFGSVISAEAHDGEWTGGFSDNVQIDVQHVDADPWKGWFEVTATNNTSTTWGDFHFILFDYFPYTSNVTFVDASGGGNDPVSTSTTLGSWNISATGKTMDLFFYDDPVAPTETFNIKVWTDNTSNQQNFAVGFYPTVVPEPVSSTLFVIGGTLFGAMRLRKKKTSA